VSYSRNLAVAKLAPDDVTVGLVIRNRTGCLLTVTCINADKVFYKVTQAPEEELKYLGVEGQTDRVDFVKRSRDVVKRPRYRKAKKYH
jgi:hypothetical protein